MAQSAEADALNQLQKAQAATLMARQNLEEANRQRQEVVSLSEQLENCK